MYWTEFDSKRIQEKYIDERKDDAFRLGGRRWINWYEKEID